MGTYLPNGQWNAGPGDTMFDYYDDMEKYYDEQEKKSSSSATSNALAAAIQAQADAATAAAQIKADAAAAALAQQQAQYEAATSAVNTAVSTATTGLNPWRVAGETALGTLVSMLETGPGEYTQSADYELGLAAGQQALERSAAAKGNALSGAAVKAAQEYAQDYQMTDYDNFLQRYYNSLAPYENLSGVGANAAQQIGNWNLQGATALATAAQNYANTSTDTTIYSGESTASGLTDYSNIIANYQALLDEYATAYDAWKSGSTV